MYELVNNTLLPVREYAGQRVVTFKDIDRVHQRPDGTAGRNFRTNRKYFIEDVDYFTITPDEFRRAFLGDMDKRQQNDITLITLSGYLMIVKSFTDELSWSVQRTLVNSYFTVREQANNYSDLLRKQNELESRLNQLESRQQIPCKSDKKKSESDTEIAFYVLEKFYSFEKSAVLKRELVRKCRKLNTARVNSSLKLLDEWDYLSCRKEKGKGRPLEIVEIKHF